MGWVEIVVGLVSTIVGGVIVALLTSRMGRASTSISADRGGSVDYRPDQSRHANVSVTVVRSSAGPPVQRPPTSPSSSGDDDWGRVVLAVGGVLCGTAAFTFISPAAGVVLLATAVVLAVAFVAVLVAVRRAGLAAATRLATASIAGAIVGIAGVGVAVLVGAPGGLTLAERVERLHDVAAQAAGGAPNLSDVLTAMLTSGPRTWVELAAAAIAFLVGLALAWLAATLLLALAALRSLASRSSPFAARLATPAVTTSWAVPAVIVLLAILGIASAAAGLGWAMPAVHGG